MKNSTKVNVLLSKITNCNTEANRDILIDILLIQKASNVGKVFTQKSQFFNFETSFELVDVYKGEFFFKNQNSHVDFEHSFELYSLSIKQLKQLVLS